MPPSGDCSSGFQAAHLRYLLVEDLTLEKSLCRQNHFAILQTKSVSKSRAFLGMIPILLLWGIEFYQGEVSSLRTQICLRAAFLPPLFLKLSNYFFFFFFKEKNALMHKTLFLPPFIYLKLNLTKSVLSKHYLWVMPFVYKEHWLKRYRRAVLSLLCVNVHNDKALVSVCIMKL